MPLPTPSRTEEELLAWHNSIRIPEMDEAAMRALRPGDHVTVLCMGLFLQHCSATGNLAVVETVGRKYVTVRSQTSGRLRCPIADSEAGMWGRRFGLAKQRPMLPVLKFKRVSDVLAWIDSNVKPYDANTGEPLPRWTYGDLERAAIWWWAHEEAQSGAYSELTTKDIARLLVAGIKPTTLSDVQAALDELHELGPDEGPSTPALEIEANLRNHFNTERRNFGV
jgi:hypothetical protein